MPEQEELFVDLPNTGDTVEVNIEDPPKDGTALSVETSVDSEDEEHVEYSKKVQRRIDKLTKKAREAERQQEAAIN